MSQVDLEIRHPVIEDVDEMGRVHVRAWQAAYRSIMPDAYLDGLRAEDRASMWRRQIDRGDADGILVGVVSGEVVGFVAFGTAGGEPAAERTAEIYSINVDPARWGAGIGRSLLRAATDALAARGFEHLVLWTVPQNARATRLYQSEGWVVDGESRDQEVLGVVVNEVRYVRRPQVPEL